MKMKPVAAVVLCAGAASMFSALSTTESVAAPSNRPGAPGGTPRPAPSRTPRATPAPGATPEATRTPRPALSPRPTPTRPAPSRGQHATKLIEGALSITLTEAQVTAVEAADAARDTAIKAAVASFRDTVAGIFDLTPTELQTKIKSARPKPDSDLETVLAAALGRALTSEEVIALNGALASRDAAVKAAIATFRESVAGTVGLSVAELDAKIAAYVAGRPGPKGGSNGGQSGS